MAGAKADANTMVRAADDLKGPVTALGTEQVQVALTGASGMWSDFNEANRSAMMRSELFSWPVTLGILVLAFGSLVAAGLPLLLTMLGLLASAGSLFLLTKVSPISIWAMNFALMFALALGIDYALFIVDALPRRAVRPAREPRRRRRGDDGHRRQGRALQRPDRADLADRGDARRQPRVPLDGRRHHALGHLHPRRDADAAARGARQARHQGRQRSRCRGSTKASTAAPRFAAWGEYLWRRPWALGIATVAVLGALAIPVLSLNTGMPSIKVVPKTDTSRQGYELVQQAFGIGAPGALQVTAPAADAARVRALLAADPAIAQVTPPQPGASGNVVLLQAVPKVDPSSKQLGTAIDRLRATLPAGTMVGGAPAENHDLEAELASKTPLVIGVVLGLGFLLLLIALQAPLIAAIGVVTNLLATGAAFGVAKLIFQEGHASGLLGFEPQGFLDAWGPVFFFAMIFAISMDYTVFLLSSAKEHWDRTGDAKDAMVGGLAHSGRVIFAAGAVMVAVFFTFALSGPLPPKEMGIILGIAVLLDALLVRLLLVPILLRLTGTKAWYLPRWLDRILPDVRFGH